MRRDQARPPTASPAGIATGAMVTAARTSDPAATWCQEASQARYGAAATCRQDLVVIAVAASHTPTMGRHHSAARYSRRGGQPRSQATVTAPVATRDTGAAAMTTSATAAYLASLPAARTAASTASRPRYRRITGGPAGRGSPGWGPAGTAPACWPPPGPVRRHPEARGSRPGWRRYPALSWPWRPWAGRRGSTGRPRGHAGPRRRGSVLRRRGT